MSIDSVAVVVVYLRGMVDVVAFLIKFAQQIGLELFGNYAYL